MLAHPRFPLARDEFVKAVLALYEHKPFLNRLLLEASRTVVVCVIMCLHARYDEDDRGAKEDGTPISRPQLGKTY